MRLIRTVPNWIGKSLLSLFMLSFLMLLLSACGDDPSQQKEKPQPTHLVKTMVVKKSGDVIRRNYPGRVIATKRVNLAFQVYGQLIEFPVDDGELVKKGQMLAKLDPRDYQFKLDSDKAQLRRNKAQYDRASRLLKTGDISVSMYDTSRAAYEQAVASVNKSQKALNDTKLIAPYHGLVAITYVENFENVLAKQKILSLQDVSYVDIIINLPEQVMIKITQKEAQIRRGGSLDEILTFDSLPNRKFKVSLKEFTTEADPVTQTFDITVTMPNPPDLNILPGMTATLTSEQIRKGNDIQLVPVSAVIVDDNGNHFTWIVDEKNMTVTKRLLKVGDLTDGQVRVIDGLKPGEIIVVAGAPYLNEGAKIRILKGIIGRD